MSEDTIAEEIPFLSNVANQGRFQAKDADQGRNIYVMIVEDKERTEKIIEIRRDGRRKMEKICRRLSGGCLAAVILIGVFEVIRYAMYGDMTALITVCIIEGAAVLICISAWGNLFSGIFLLMAVGFAVLAFITNNSGSTLMDNKGYILQAACGIFGCIISLLLLRKRGLILPRKRRAALLGLGIALLAGAGIIWLAGTRIAHAAAGNAEPTIWEVPAEYDETESRAPGTVEKLQYETKAYATDGRTVEKTAYVYLPFGYNKEQQYNILYLMHGTGDDEAYWLETFPYNKVMIDNMIEKGDIDPLIIVTPTFYVENDCADDLDRLTYSFKDELRNDLMPAVESTYSTYAESCDDEGFFESRDHRAFAGLSRGAVTMYHSVMCGSLDYFSWFGAFSGSRTDAEYFREHLQTEEWKDLPINYLYVSSGTFDFALPGQIEDYQALLNVEPRLEEGDNTEFVIYPGRYHSIGSWHLALYNFLPKIFGDVAK